MKSMTDWIALVMICLTIGLCTALGGASAEQQDDKRPWFNREKIRFFWGTWYHFWDAGISPEQMMEDLSHLNVTVYADRQLRKDSREFITCYQDEFLGLGEPLLEGAADSVTFDLELARLTHKYGIRFFGSANTHNVPFYAKELARTKSLRWAIDQKGDIQVEKKWQLKLPCPMDELFYEKWIFAPTLEAARTGLVDGLHFDWEPYGDRREAEVCYCDACFDVFLKGQQIRTIVPKAERYKWLKERRLEDKYVEVNEQRREEFWRNFARRVHEIKPDFVFSGYDTYDCPASIYHGLNSPQAPFIIIDPSHYVPNHTAPWWESYYSDYRKLGMKHVLGTWTGGMFGEAPFMDVSAAQWMYDAAINHDGYWLWFENQWGPNDYRAFRTAERLIRTTENRVGEFLLKGEQDHKFVCLVEQSGDPDLGQNVIQRSFHLPDKHLVQVNNVNTDIPVEVLVRFGKLPADAKWTVKDPLGDLYYVPARGNTLWSNQELGEGVLLSMEKRAETWLLLSPVSDSSAIDPDKTVYGRVIKAHPERLKTQNPLPAGTAQNAGFPLVYLKSGPLGYRAAPTSPNPVMGTSVHYIDAAGAGLQAKQLFEIKGNCWSATFSPDRTKIAFSCYVNGKGQIYLINSDGSNPYNLSNNDYCDKSPAWSPDGKKIAFVSDRDIDWEVYVMNVDGTDQRRLTDSPGDDRRPTWSPDGKHIAFESNRGGDFDIYVINTDGSDEKCLIHRAGNDYEPIWSPDGRNIACTTYQHGYKRDVVVMDAETGSSVHPLGLTYAAKGYWQFKEIQSICFSPDGKWVAGTFDVSSTGDSRTGIFTVGADGKNLRLLVSREPLKPYPGGLAPNTKHLLMGGWYFNGSASRRWLPKTFGNVSWSPDGSTLAFSSDMDKSGYSFFYTMGVMVKFNMDMDFIGDLSDYPSGNEGWSLAGTGKNTQWDKNAPGIITIDRSGNSLDGATAFNRIDEMGFSGPYVHGLMRVKHEVFGKKMDTYMELRDARSDTHFTISSIKNVLVLGHGSNHSQETSIPVVNDDLTFHDIEWELHLPTKMVRLFFDGVPIGAKSGYKAVSGQSTNQIMWGDGLQNTSHKTHWDRFAIQEGRVTDKPTPVGELTRLDATLHPAGPHNKVVDSGNQDAGVEHSGYGATPPAEAHYLDGTTYRDWVLKLRLAANLPVEGWAFKADSAGVGAEKGYFNPNYSTADFSTIRIGDFWDDQGHAGLKEGWYRFRYVCPELPEGKRMFLHFDAVDESAWLYVDGKLIAWYDTADPDKTWDKPFLLEVTGSLKSQTEHLLAIRVRNVAGAGGIWKPVSLWVEK